jgi:hypothetical protein
MPTAPSPIFVSAARGARTDVGSEQGSAPAASVRADARKPSPVERVFAALIYRETGDLFPFPPTADRGGAQDGRRR